MHTDSVSIPAHFDGERIQLDEPVQLEPNARLIVTILPAPNAEREEWRRVSALGLGSAYGADETEYGMDSVKELNPEYEGG